MAYTPTLAFSTCPNDTFIFKAIAQKLIPTQGMDFQIVLKDVEALNQDAATSTWEITKLSFAALGSLLDRYALLRAGAALGKGCGPLVISLPNRSLHESVPPGSQQLTVGVPGMNTTAFYLFRFYLADQFPGVQVQFQAIPFDRIMPAVIEKKIDFGVIIHEGRFVYQALDLQKVADLGQWWEKKTSLPIPLGCIAIRRDLGQQRAGRIQSLIAKSIDHAFLHPRAGAAYIQKHAQEMAPDVIQQHIDLYVNDYSKDIGETGTTAVTTFFEFAVRAGLMPKPNAPLFAC